jgi:hypothetical protein
MRRASKNSIPMEIPRGMPSALPLLLPEEEPDALLPEESDVLLPEEDFDGAKLKPATAIEMVGADEMVGVDEMVRRDEMVGADVAGDVSGIVGSAEGELIDLVLWDLVIDFVIVANVVVILVDPRRVEVSVVDSRADSRPTGLADSRADPKSGSSSGHPSF